MAKRDMKKALGASLKAEEKAVKSRFAKAKTVSRKKVAARPKQLKSEETDQVIRESFTLLDSEEELISRIKGRCLNAGISVNTSEVSRAGLAALDAMQDRELERLFEGLLPVKRSRPGLKIRVFVVHGAADVKLRKPLQIKRLQFARRIVANKIVTIRREN